MLYSNEDFENFYVRYKAEGVPIKICMKDFCIRNKVPWNLFDKWYRDTHHRIVPVQVMGREETENFPNQSNVECEKNAKQASATYPDSYAEKPDTNKPIRIMVDIRMTNGIQLRQKNLNYDQLLSLVEKLEALC